MFSSLLLLRFFSCALFYVLHFFTVVYTYVCYKLWCFAYWYIFITCASFCCNLFLPLLSIFSVRMNLVGIEDQNLSEQKFCVRF